MSIRGFRFIIMKLQVDQKHIPIPFPIPLYIFQEILDCFSDLLTFASLFVPNNSYPNSSSPITVHGVREMINSVMLLLDSITDGEPYDLVDVTTDRVKVSIKIR